MSTSQLWITLACIAIGTYICRLSFVLLLAKKEIPPVVRRILRYIPPATLTALVFPAFFYFEGSLNISTDNINLIAGAVATLVAFLSRNIMVILCCGMVTLWFFSGLFDSFF